MSGILEQAIEFLQNQSKSMQTMIGSGGNTGSSGGIGSVFPQTPMGGGMDTAPTTQPSTMEIPTPPVTTPPPVTPPTSPPVTATPPIVTAPTSPPPVTATPPAPSDLGNLSTNPVDMDRYKGTPFPFLGEVMTPEARQEKYGTSPSDLGKLLSSRIPMTPQERYAGTDIDQGFFDSNEYQQSQQGPQTQDMGYTSDIFGSGLSSSRGRAQDQAYQDYLNRTGQGQGQGQGQGLRPSGPFGQLGIFGNQSNIPNSPELDARKKALGIAGGGFQGSTQGQSIFNNPVMNQPRLLQQPQVLGGSQFSGLGAYQGADQAQLQQLMQQRQQMGGMQQMGNMNPRFGGIAQQFGQNQAIPAQAIPAQMSPNNFGRGPRPQVQLPSGATDQQKNMLMQKYQQARQTPTPMQNNFQTGLGQMGGMNQLFGRAFAGKPV